MTPRLEARPTALEGQSRRRVLTAILVGACVLLFRGAPAIGQSAQGPSFVRVIGTVPQCGLLNEPMGIAVSPVAPYNIYVIDAGNARIQAFRNVGRPGIGCWGSRGEAGHQFWRPRDLAFSPKGDFIYVVDAGAGIIKQFRPDKICFDSNDPGCRNAPSLSWGGIGSGPGTFQDASGVAVDSRGLVYVADAGRHDVQVFDENGTPIRDLVIGGPGNENDDLRGPRDLDIGPQGRVWVADTGNDRIAIFERNGELSKSLMNGVDGFWRPSGISVAPDGGFIVRDFDPSYRTPRLWKFDAEGRRTGGPIALDGRDEGSFYYQQGVDFMPDGTAVLANPYAGLSRLLDPEAQQINLMTVPNGRNDLMPLALRGRAPGQFADPRAAAIDDRLLVISDLANRRVQVLDAEKDYLPVAMIGAPTLELEAPMAVAVYRTGEGPDDVRIYIADMPRHTIHVVGGNGAPIDRWGDGRSRGSVDGLSYPHGLAVDRDGQVYIADTNNHRVVRRAPDGTVINLIGEKQLESPKGVAVGPDGNIYVIEEGQPRLTAYTPDGELVKRWDAEAVDNRRPAAGELHQPRAIAADDRYVYLYENDTRRHMRATVLDPDPALPLEASVVATFSDSAGAGPGLVDAPMGIAAHKDGRVVIVDTGNNRVQLFRWSGAPPTPTPTEEPSPTATEAPSRTPTALASETPTPAATETGAPTEPSETQTPREPSATPVAPGEPSPTSKSADTLVPRPRIYLPQLIIRY